MSRPWQRTAYGARPGSSGSASVVRCAALVCLFLGIGYVITLSSPTIWALWEVHVQYGITTGSTSPISALGDDDVALGIRLHPQDHATRPPRTIELDWNITQGVRTPDGVRKRVYLVNGEFPGPTIEARSGDELVVHVVNGLADEGLSLHWHGLRLAGQNLMDGAVGLTQCPISPGGGSFTYRVRIGDDEYGTFWWHSHEMGQRADGLFGGLVVHRPIQEQKQEKKQLAIYDDMLLMIGDWFHASAADTQRWYSSYEHFGNEPVPDSLLVNGRGRFDCAMAVPARPVQCSPMADGSLALMAAPRVGQRSAPDTPGTAARWRIVNTGSIVGLSLAVPQSTMTPIYVDGGHPVAAVSGDGIGILYPGERIDLFVRWPADRPSRLYISMDPENLRYKNPALRLNQSFPITAQASQSVEGQEQEKTQPFPEASAAVQLDSLHADTTDAGGATKTPDWDTRVDQTLVIYAKVQVLAEFGNRPKGYMNHSSWTPQTPPLASLARSAWNGDQLVPFVGGRSRDEEPETSSWWVDLVINNLDDGAHPFHLHGYAFYVLSRYRTDGRAGWGSYNPFDQQKPPPGGLDLTAPLLKDTVMVPRRGHVVVRFRADNPGIWMLHCHMAVHLGSGLAMALHVGGLGDNETHAAMQLTATDLCGE